MYEEKDEYRPNTSRPVESEVFSTISRINNKLESLAKILDPIIILSPSLAKEKPSTHRLGNALIDIEDKITALLDSVRI